MIKTTDFDYFLPPELIANQPAPQRDFSRLLTLGRESREIGHFHFYDIVDLLKEGDILVLNDSKVIPARLMGNKVPGGAAIEFLLLERREENLWEILVRPGRKAQPGSEFTFGGGKLTGRIIEILPGGNRLARFEYQGDSMLSVLDEVGTMPLPHYITAPLEDKRRYQTVYAKVDGSAAAPTAGLHFTSELIERLKNKGIAFAYLTLHVGLGTFRPVKADSITDHHMHSEYYELPQSAAEAVNLTKRRGGRVIAVGTTSCRTLESVAGKYGDIRADSGHTEIFIYPGYQFKAVDGLITNFHLPQSTLIMLVSAFAGRGNVLNAYRVAIEQRYRFYSFGDAMLIV